MRRLQYQQVQENQYILHERHYKWELIEYYYLLKPENFLEEFFYYQAK